MKLAQITHLCHEISVTQCMFSRDVGTSAGRVHRDVKDRRCHGQPSGIGWISRGRRRGDADARLTSRRHHSVHQYTISWTNTQYLFLPEWRDFLLWRGQGETGRAAPSEAARCARRRKQNAAGEALSCGGDGDGSYPAWTRTRNKGTKIPCVANYTTG